MILYGFGSRITPTNAVFKKVINDFIELVGEMPVGLVHEGITATDTMFENWAEDNALLIGKFPPPPNIVPINEIISNLNDVSPSPHGLCQMKSIADRLNIFTDYALGFCYRNDPHCLRIQARLQERGVRHVMVNLPSNFYAS